jgi:hypothetical protein
LSSGKGNESPFIDDDDDNDYDGDGDGEDEDDGDGELGLLTVQSITNIMFRKWTTVQNSMRKEIQRQVLNNVHCFRCSPQYTKTSN